MTHFSSEQTALLRAVLTNHAEDTPRLVFADWLEENGQPDRAEFIRVQCEWARMPGCDPVCSHEYGHRKDCVLGECGEALRRRERELLTFEMQAKWYGCFTHYDNIEVTITRGFISHVTCTAEYWLQHADALYWNPSQVVECPACREAQDDPEVGGAIRSCTCKGTGRVPRPFIHTAQPLERVTLTDLPFQRGRWLIGVSDVETARWIDANDHSQGFTDERWSGIKFFLPPYTLTRGTLQRIFDSGMRLPSSTTTTHEES